MSSKKIRLSVTLPKPQLDGIDRLVLEGVYLDRGGAIRDAIRLLLHVRGITPFIIGKFPPEETKEAEG